MVHIYKERHDVVVKGLNKIPGISCTSPQGTFYAFPNIEELGCSSLELAEYLLREGHVVTVPGTAFGKEGEDHIRISYSTPMEAIKEGLNRIEQAVDLLS